MRGILPARFIVGDCRSREPGCVTSVLHKLDLPTQTTTPLSLYKVVEGLVPAMPVEQFLKPFPANKRQNRPTKFQDFTAKNIIDRQATLNAVSVAVSVNQEPRIPTTQLEKERLICSRNKLLAV